MPGRSGSSQARTLTEKLIAAHLVEGDMADGGEIALRIDQTLTQDGTGTMVMLDLANFGVLPLPVDYRSGFDRLLGADKIVIDGIHTALEGRKATIEVETDQGDDIETQIALYGRQFEIVRAGGLINHAACGRSGQGAIALPPMHRRGVF